MNFIYGVIAEFGEMAKPILLKLLMSIISQVGGDIKESLYQRVVEWYQGVIPDDSELNDLLPALCYDLIREAEGQSAFTSEFKDVLAEWCNELYEWAKDANFEPAVEAFISIVLGIINRPMPAKG